MPRVEGDLLPGAGQSLTYAHGDSVTVETTALAVLAMMKTGQFTNSVNKALTYLVKSKDAARHLGQHPGDDPGAQGAGGRGWAARSRRARLSSPSASTARRRPTAK